MSLRDNQEKYEKKLKEQGFVTVKVIAHKEDRDEILENGRILRDKRKKHLQSLSCQYCTNDHGVL